MPPLPSLKPKKRYIVFRIISSESYSSAEVEAKVQEALLHFLGELGVARAAPIFIKEKYKNNKFILKVGHKYVDEVKSALVLIKSIKKTPVILCSVTVSGTLKKASSCEVCI